AMDRGRTGSGWFGSCGGGLAASAGARRAENHRGAARNHRRGDGEALSGRYRLAAAADAAHISAVMIRRLLLCAVLSLSLVAPARAIDSGALFETELERLSEILGALHYLRGLCGAKDGQKWRNEMRALL